MALEIQQSINQLVSSAQWATSIAVHQPNVQAERKRKADIKQLEKQKETLQQYDTQYGEEVEFFRSEIEKNPNMTEEQKAEAIKNMESSNWYQRHETEYSKAYKAIESKLSNLDPEYKQQKLMSDLEGFKQKTYRQALTDKLKQYTENHQADNEARHMILNPEPKIKPREVNKDGK